MKANIALACVEAASTRAEPERRSRAPAMSASTALGLQHCLRPVTIGMMKNQHHDDRRKARPVISQNASTNDPCSLSTEPVITGARNPEIAKARFMIPNAVAAHLGATSTLTAKYTHPRAPLATRRAERLRSAPWS